MNVLTLGGRLVADPNKVSDNIVTFRVAVDYSGSSSVNPDQRTGFFNVKYFLNTGSPNATFIRNQVDEGKMKKGSAILLVGEIKAEEYKDKNDQTRQEILVIADNVTYMGGGASTSNGTEPAMAGAASSSSSSIPVPDEF